jgi:predicted ATP-grasp superfamily ATP-dependent carboligase
VDALILRASPNSLSAARSLGRAGLNVVVAATGADRAIRFSRYVSRMEHLKDLDDRTICTRLMEIPIGNGKPFLFATGDEDVLAVAQHQERLRERYCFVVPSYETVRRIIDKASLYSLAKAHGIRHPKFRIVRDAKDIEPAVAHVETPCYVKPALVHEWSRFRRGKLDRADTPDALRHILHELVELKVVVMPLEIIPGDDSQVYSVCTYIDHAGNPVDWRNKHKLRQYPPGAGNACCQEVCDVPEVTELGLNVLALTGHRGPATVEFRRDPRDGRFVLMEINARTILGQEMISHSGFDVPLLAYHEAKGLPFPPAGRMRRTRWVIFGDDFRAVRVLRARGEITTWAWIRTLLRCNSFGYFRLDDPLPFFVRLWMWLGGLFRRRRPAATNRQQAA